MMGPKHTDEIIQAALDHTLNNGWGRSHVQVDKNLMDAFTSSWLEAGVDSHELDAVFAAADLARIPLDQAHMAASG